MNPINALLRRFGTREQKIRAIEYDMQKKQDEIEYTLSNLSRTEDFYLREYWQKITLELELSIDADRLDLELLE